MIISIVEQLVAQLDVPANINAVESNIKFGFNHGASHWQNLLNDEYDFGDFDGVVFLDQPITTEYQLTAGGYIGEFYPVTLFFMMKSELDWTPQEHEANCIDPTNNAVRQFISICQSRTDLVDEITTPTALEFVNLLDVNVSGKSLSIKIKPYINKSVCVPGYLPVCSPASILDSDGITRFDVASGGNGTCTPVSLINISNSNDSYSVDTLVNLELPNIDFTDSDGITTSVASMESITATPCEVKSGIAYQRPQVTCQTATFNDGDDGYNLANGIYNYTPPVNPIHLAELDLTAINPFLTLKNLNEKGTLDRYTDINGLQVYGDGYIIDHLTGNGHLNSFTAAGTFTGVQDDAFVLTANGFSDWRIVNRNEALSILDYSSSVGYNYEPFNLSSGSFWLSTSRLDSGATAANGYFLVTTNGITSSSNKTGIRESFLVRTHYT